MPTASEGWTAASQETTVRLDANGITEVLLGKTDDPAVVDRLEGLVDANLLVVSLESMEEQRPSIWESLFAVLRPLPVARDVLRAGAENRHLLRIDDDQLREAIVAELVLPQANSVGGIRVELSLQRPKILGFSVGDRVTLGVATSEPPPHDSEFANIPWTDWLTRQQTFTLGAEHFVARASFSQVTVRRRLTPDLLFAITDEARELDASTLERVRRWAGEHLHVLRPTREPARPD
jgi:hypothetical protein